MKDTAPKGLGIIAVAALFGLVALLVSYLVLNFVGFASCLIGAIVALITAIVLWLGWREPASGPIGHRDLSADANSDKAASYTTKAPSAASSSAGAPATAASFAGSATATAPAPAASAKAAAKTAKPAAKTAKPAAAKAAKPAAAKAAKPETLTKARAGGADDLKQIKGVGPGLEKTLNELGFYHFDQIQNWRKAEIEWVDSRLKFPGRIVRDEWTKQAKTLAKVGTTEFPKKVKKGGVY
jgi:predicted flap endonuclease-1-like 5' DNA nuclease